MRKKQNTKTVQFANLTEDHKAEFIHFLIKNNICFQQGKENCTAQVSIKPNKTSTQKPLKETNTPVQPLVQKHNKNDRDLHSKTVKVQKQTASDHVFKQLKTPTKDTKKQLGVSSLSCKGRSSTIKKPTNQTPRSVHKPNPKNKSNTAQIKEYDSKNITSSSKIYIEHQKTLLSKNSKQLVTSKEKDSVQVNSQKPQKKSEVQRDRLVNRYTNLFELGENGRAIRWPINLLQRAIQQIYDDIFTKNTQCLQNKNIGTAIKTLTLTSFPQLVQTYFRKKFKGSKLTATNLNNMLFSLSYYITRENCPIIVKTFEDFLLSKLHHQDLLYYLFARSILKKEMRVIEKIRDSHSIEGSYFIEGLRARDIGKYLRGIIGKDSDLLNQYKNLILSKMQNEQINAYYFLRILLEDYHSKRLNNRSNEFTNGDSFGNTLFEAEYSYEHNDHKNTQQLTFGEQPQCSYEEQREFQYADFWNCQSYSRINDNLYDLIMEKMQKKVVELIQILILDTDHHPQTITQLENLLLRKSESLVTAIFEMNKMKWFKELNISSPCQQDMNFVEGVQIRLRQLRENPSGKDIGQFCKNILTTKALVNELQLSLMINN